MHLLKYFQAVDYKGISGSSEFQSYLRLTKELQRVKILDASREEKLAFFINIYNALVIHANIVLGPPVNLWQRYKVKNLSLYWIINKSLMMLGAFDILIQGMSKKKNHYIFHFQLAHCW